MKRYDISESWRLLFEHDGTHHNLEASVPGNVQLDLLAADIIPDPYMGENIHLLSQFEFTNWTYRRSISPAELGEAVKGSTFLLRFEGIDTVARIRINGTEVGRSENMFVPALIDISRWCAASEPFDLEVEIKSAARQAWGTTRAAGAVALPYNYESLYLRKARHSFGWDIAPRLVTAGIWRPVYIERHDPVEIGDVYVFTDEITDRGATIGVDWNVSAPPILENAALRLSIRNPANAEAAGAVVPVRFPTGRSTMAVDNPELWWPAGYGDAPLYSLVVTLECGGQVVDTRSIRFGIRRVTLHRSDAIGGNEKQFRFDINNVPIFVRGSNWVPSDALHSRCAAKTRENLAPYRDSGCNMLRIWGGGIYEDESLFDFCDENGIMIWQDFMFACEIPPHDEEYYHQVREEIEVIAKRYRNHPALVLWCGDNENDAAIRKWHRAVTGINNLTREIIPAVLADHDPYRPYLPSSPYISEAVWEEHMRGVGSRGREIDEMIPEQHLWGPRDAFKGDFYRLNTAVFASEIGYHGCPSEKSIRRFITEEALDRDSEAGRRQWNAHASQPYGDPDGRYAYRIELMSKQIAMLFGTVPEELESYIAASQISQAEAKKFFIESFRMRKWEKTGIIWWNMQDMWPQFSDAVIDYYGEKKLAWYYIAASQRPVCIMVDEPDSWIHRVIGVNDTLSAARGTFTIKTADGVSVVGPADFTIPPNGTAELAEIRYGSAEPEAYLISWGGSHGEGRNHYVAAAPPISLDGYLKQWLPVIVGDQRPDWM